MASQRTQTRGFRCHGMVKILFFINLFIPLTARCDAYCPYNADCAASWRVFIAKGFRDGSSDVRFSDNGLVGHPEYRNLSNPWSREGPCSSTGRKEYIHCRDGTWLSSCSSTIFWKHHILGRFAKSALPLHEAKVIELFILPDTCNCLNDVCRRVLIMRS